MVEERDRDILRRAGYGTGPQADMAPPKSEMEKAYEEIGPASGIRRAELWKFVQDLKGKTPDEFGGWLFVQEARPKSKVVRAIDLWNYTAEGDMEAVRRIRREIEKGEWNVKE